MVDTSGLALDLPVTQACNAVGMEQAVAWYSYHDRGAGEDDVIRLGLKIGQAIQTGTAPPA